MHALKNLELAHYVDRLQYENDELRKLMGWLSGHEPQLRMMIEAVKRRDGEGLGANKVGEGSGENIQEPPKTHHKNDFPPKPNHLRNRLEGASSLRAPARNASSGRSDTPAARASVVCPPRSHSSRPSTWNQEREKISRLRRNIWRKI
jgi:hypothetical protein